MTTNDAGLFPVDVEQYRAALVVAGKENAAAIQRLRDSRQDLRRKCRAANNVGVAVADMSRLSGIPRKTITEWLKEAE